MCIIVSSHIHKIWSIVHLNRGYIDPTDSMRTVSDVNRRTVDQQLADFVFDFFCFLGSAGGKKNITDQFDFWIWCETIS